MLRGRTYLFVWHCSVTLLPNGPSFKKLVSWNDSLLSESKNKAMQSVDGGGQQFGIRPPGGVVNQQGAVPVQSVAGADPINALQNLTKQPVPASMVQPGESTYSFGRVL